MSRLKLLGIPALLAVLLAGGWMIQRGNDQGSKVAQVAPAASETAPGMAKLNKKHAPAEHYFQTRSWPDGELSVEVLSRGLQQAQADARALKQGSTARGGGAAWELEGPTNIGGRINTIAVHPSDHNIIYVGCASGGIFKTTDGGSNWFPIFDDQLFLPIGDIELDPNNPDIVYAGTGDPNVSGYPFIGDGLYRSTDAGATWTNLGLSETRIISRVRVHPLNSNLIYVGAMGQPFEKDGNRGLYKSTDGGDNWSKILHISDSTGICDFLIDEFDPDRVWAAGWDRLRSTYYTMVYGPGAIIRRTNDGGDNWTTLSAGLPAGPQCRIGLDQEPGNPNHLIAQYIGTDMETQGVYESINGGNTWVPYNVSGLNSSSAMGGFGWYFAKVRFNPFLPGQVWVCGVNLWRTLNNGTTWNNMTTDWNVHADKHDLVFLSSTEALLATDGGLYRTTNSGSTWTRADNIPNTQFYHIKINPHASRDYWGGSQDNGTSRGSGIAPEFWQRIFGGDGFHTEFDPIDANNIFVETQNGEIWHSTDGGFWFDWLTSTLPFFDRRSWDMPYILSPHDPGKLYAGTYRMHKAEAPLFTFTSLSGDLTKGVLTDPRFHNLTSIRESYVTEGLLYAGASDGRLSRSDNAGASWTTIDAGLPNRYITDVECSHINSDVVIVTHSAYKSYDFSPLIHYSQDRGNTWQPIAGDLPDLGINDMQIYPGNDSVLFVGNDGGVYYSLDLGTSWSRLGSGMPVVNVYDIELDTRLGKLLAGTHGRSLLSLDLADVTPSYLRPELSLDAVICAGDSLALEASGALHYSWSPAAGLSCTDCPNPVASPASTTTYTVVFNDGLGHLENRTVTVEVAEHPEIPLLVQSGDSLLLSTGASALLSYRWYRDGVLLPGETQPFLLPEGDGLYTVEVFNDAGCSTLSEAFTYISTGMTATWVQGWSYGPVPMRDELHLQLPTLPGQASYRVRLYDAMGQLIAESQEPSGSARLSFAQQPSGLYFLEVDAQGQSRTVKLLRH